MMSKAIRYLTTIILAIFITASYCRAHDYGLRIKGHSYHMKDNTTLLLSPDKPFVLDDGMTIRFHMTIRQEQVFGNILSISPENGRTLYCMIPAHGNNSARVALKYGSEVVSHPARQKCGKETEVSITVDSHGHTRMLIDGRSVDISTRLSHARRLSLSFGRPLGRFENHETASVDIRDVKISRNGNDQYHWMLRQHNDSVCYDEISHTPAVAIHGHWILDDHVCMKRIVHLREHGLIQTTYDASADRFIIADGRTLRRHDPATGITTTEVIAGGHRAMPHSNHLAYSPFTGQIYSYNLTEATVSTYDADTRRFSADVPSTYQPRHYNHSFALADSSTAYAFGGYGYFRYSNDLFRISTDRRQIEKMTYSPLIPPRNSAACCVVDGKLYIFGGFGNETGRQELDCHYYYDMHCIDLRTMKSRCLWKAEAPTNDFIVTSEMIWNPADSSFYVGTTSSDGAIARISMNRPQWNFVVRETGCPFNYRDFTFDIYRSDRLQQIFIVIDMHLDNNLHDISVYSVDMPLMPSAQITQSVAAARPSWQAILTGVLATVAAAIGAWRITSGKKKKEPKPVTPSVPAATSAEAIPAENIAAGDTTVGNPTTQPAGAKSKIELLGKFTVTDNAGNNITGTFTSLLRDLLVMMVLDSAPGRNGISKDLLDTTLWTGMDEKKAQANRQVNISRLRSLLRKLDGITVEKDRMAFRIATDATCHIDYYEALTRMVRYEAGGAPDPRLATLLCRGPLLPEMSFEWLDSFKTEYSALAIKTLRRMSRTWLDLGNHDTTCRCAAGILLHDPFHEDALRLLCRCHCIQKNTGAAKAAYEKFCRIYSEAMGEPFTPTFAEICNTR